MLQPNASRPALLREVEGFEPAGGHAYVARLSPDLPHGDTGVEPQRSSLVLLEDGAGLGPSHAMHAEIRQAGLGRYSHWHDTLYLSASDNSDPRSNGRRYAAFLPPQAGDYARQEALRTVAALPDGYDRRQAYAAVERCLALLDPLAKLGEDEKLFWHDERFIRTYEELSGRNYRALERKYAVHSLLRSLGHVPGNLAECGTYNGATAQVMASACAEMGQARPLHLFDSFEGLSSPTGLDGTHWVAGALACPEEEVARNLAGFTNVRLHKGWIPERFHEVADRRFCFVHVDVDLHAPTAASMEFFYPRLNAGGMIVCDDYGFTTCPGATRAMDDFFRSKPERVVHLPTGQGLVIKQ